MCFISDAKIFFDGFTAEKLMHFCPVMYLNWACLAKTGIHWKNKSFRNAGSWALYWCIMIVLSILIDERANLDFSDPQFQPLQFAFAGPLGQFTIPSTNNDNSLE